MAAADKKPRARVRSEVLGRQYPWVRAAKMRADANDPSLRFKERSNKGAEAVKAKWAGYRKRVVWQISFPRAMASALRVWADFEDGNVSGLVQRALREKFERLENEHGPRPELKGLYPEPVITQRGTPPTPNK